MNCIAYSKTFFIFVEQLNDTIILSMKQMRTDQESHDHFYAAFYEAKLNSTTGFKKLLMAINYMTYKFKLKIR